MPQTWNVIENLTLGQQWTGAGAKPWDTTEARVSFLFYLIIS